MFDAFLRGHAAFSDDGVHEVVPPLAHDDWGVDQDFLSDAVGKVIGCVWVLQQQAMSFVEVQLNVRHRIIIFQEEKVDVGVMLHLAEAVGQDGSTFFRGEWRKPDKVIAKTARLDEFKHRAVLHHQPNMLAAGKEMLVTVVKNVR